MGYESVNCGQVGPTVEGGDGRYDIENFGLFNPEEAQKEYGHRYYDRYNRYHSTALGNFLFQVPEAYQ